MIVPFDRFDAMMAMYRDGYARRGLDYADLLAPIVVLEPVTGQRVSSPLTVVGTADVYEATVNVRVLDGAGRQLATTFTTASLAPCVGPRSSGARLSVSSDEPAM